MILDLAQVGNLSVSQNLTGMSRKRMAGYDGDVKGVLQRKSNGFWHSFYFILVKNRLLIFDVDKKGNQGNEIKEVVNLTQFKGIKEEGGADSNDENTSKFFLFVSTKNASKKLRKSIMDIKYLIMAMMNTNSAPDWLLVLPLRKCFYQFKLKAAILNICQPIIPQLLLTPPREAASG